ncbi:MAG: tRNA (adenosine(37)-N6)-dimethylallyltransferase MiaA [Rickettsiales bacterium]|nr:tRNA (adenosine(37)-N6)-dimethylallyltransferase MiaA [Rickettsiales bacterium]
MGSHIVIVAGPTASGKSARALSLAQKHGGVIINADSQQLYQELRVVTARPSAEEEALVPHKLYGFLSGAQSCSAGKWLIWAKMEIDWALSHGLTPIVVGGTGLYLKALMQGIAAIPDIDAAVRAQAANDYEAMGKEAFIERLRAVDPAFFERLKVYDRQRLIRAYEVWLGSGKPLSFWQQQTAASAYAPEQFQLERVEIDRETLYQRCNARFLAMIEQGAIDEVKQLLLMNLPADMPVMKSLGVPELSAYIQGKIPLETAIEKAQQTTRNYAKRQLTWFRHQL